MSKHDLAKNGAKKIRIHTAAGLRKKLHCFIEGIHFIEISGNSICFSFCKEAAIV
jgi:hypothetical protein